MPAEGAPIFRHAHHDVIRIFDADRSADRVFDGKERGGGPGGQDAEVLLLSQVGVAKKPPPIKLQLHHVGILAGASNQPTVDQSTGVAEASSQLADGQRPLDRRNGFPHPLEIIPGDSVGHRSVRAFGHLAGRFDRADDNVIGPEPLDLLLCFETDPLADGQQPNHAGHADEDAQHRQERSQGVQQQALDAELPGS